MVVLAHKLNTHIECFERVSCLEKQLKNSHFEHSKQPSLLQAVMEGFVDGVLILSNQGELVHANDCARRIFGQLLQPASQTSPLIEEVWRVYECRVLLFCRGATCRVSTEGRLSISDACTRRL
jgi:sensor histidine kinase regulating citrate/malate metabolism